MRRCFKVLIGKETNRCRNSVRSERTLASVRTWKEPHAKTQWELRLRLNLFEMIQI